MTLQSLSRVQQLTEDGYFPPRFAPRFVSDRAWAIIAYMSDFCGDHVRTRHASHELEDGTTIAA